MSARTAARVLARRAPPRRRPWIPAGCARIALVGPRNSGSMPANTAFSRSRRAQKPCTVETQARSSLARISGRRWKAAASFVAHVAGGLFGEGDGQDAQRVDAGFHQPAEVLDQDGGLAGAGAGHDAGIEVAAGNVQGFELAGVNGAALMRPPPLAAAAASALDAADVAVIAEAAAVGIRGRGFHAARADLARPLGGCCARALQPVLGERRPSIAVSLQPAYAMPPFKPT